MTPITLAELNLAAAIQLAALCRDEHENVRAEAAKCVLRARADVAAARAAIAMRKGGAS